MTPEFLEYELRRLPDVVSVSVDESAVTLLVNPAADADALRVVVAGMLATAGVDLAVNVLGGVAAALPPRRVAPIAIGSAAGVGVLAAAVAVAALTGALHLGAPDVHPSQTAQRPPAAATPLTTVPNFGPSTTLLPGAPLLGAPVQPSASPSPSPSPSTAETANPAETANAGLVPLPAVPHTDVPVLPGPPPAGPLPPPVTEYLTEAPSVAPPSVWPVRTDTTAGQPEPSAPVTVVPEDTQ